MALTLANLQLAMSQNNAKMKEWVTSLVGTIKTIDFKWVDALPTEEISTSTIYMVKDDSSTETNNVYIEYVYKEGSGWETFGSVNAGSINLENYYSKEEVDALFTSHVVTYTDTEVDEAVDKILGTASE